MKHLMTILVLIFFAGFGFASLADKHHNNDAYQGKNIDTRGKGHHKTMVYDYQDYVNSDIQSKTFNRNHDGNLYTEVWSFDRTSPGDIVRTEIATDAAGLAYRCRINVFQAKPESYNWTQNIVCDGNTVPPTPIQTINFDPSVVLLTDSMSPGIAWGTAGVQVSDTSATFSSFFTDKNVILGVEDVTVPAGSYENCLKIHKLREYGSLFTRVEWLCPNIGLVKRVHSANVLLELSDVTYNIP